MSGYYNLDDTDLGRNIYFQPLAGFGVRLGSDSTSSMSVDHLSSGGLTTSNLGSQLVTVRYT